MKDTARNPAQAPIPRQTPASAPAQPSPAPAQPAPAKGGAPAPKPTPPINVQWKCELKGLDAKGAAADLPEKITIGDKLLLTCDGPPAKLDPARLRIEMDPEQPPVFYVVEAREIKETSAALVVAPWLSGNQKLNNPALTDKKTRVGLGEIQVQMTSVIDPAKNPEGKPFPPLHPLSLSWPIWLWILATALVCGVLYLVGLAVRQSLRRKRLLTLLEKNSIALSPLNHFNKELRKLQRQVPLTGANWESGESRAFFQVLEKEFRWFLARELVIPAIEGSPRTIQRTLKKADPELFQHVARDLRVVLLEVKKAQTVAGANSEDAIQLVELARSVADRITKERNA